jgi:predicted carbohydrate-binding protein with CBM5 and CBM33 domain
MDLTTMRNAMAITEKAAKYCGGREYDPLLLGYDVGVVTGMVAGGGQLCSEDEVRNAILEYWEVADPKTREAEIQAGQTEFVFD